MDHRSKHFRYRGPPGLFDWARTNPLFAIGAVMFLIMAAVISTEVVLNYTGAKRFVTVESYEVTQTKTVRDVTVSIRRITYQPGFDIRPNPKLRVQEPPLVIVDGIITNDGQETLIPFVEVGGEHTGAILTAQDQQTMLSAVSILGKQQCQALGASVSMMRPGSSRRMSMRVPVGRRAEGAWLLKELEKGRLATVSFGPFYHLDCAGDPVFLDGSAIWRIEFPDLSVEQPKRLDYYPLGAPTFHAVGVEGRGYWSDWIPRLGDDG